MSDLNYQEKMLVQLSRNKRAGIYPQTKKDLADHFGISAVYADEIIKGFRSGPKANEWKEKFASYAGFNK